MNLQRLGLLLLSFFFPALALTERELQKLVAANSANVNYNVNYRYINEKKIGEVAGEPVYPQVKFRLPPGERIAVSSRFTPAHYTNRFLPPYRLRPSL